MKKIVISIFLMSTFLISSASAILNNFILNKSYSNQFTDVASNSWYYNNVKTAYELGLLNGTTTTTYSPNSDITVAEVQALVARIHSIYYNTTIEPVGGAWYTQYIEYCSKYIDNEICSMAYMEDDGTILANKPASRTYFAYLMYASIPSYEYVQINNIPDGKLLDVDTIAFGHDVDKRIYTLYRAGILSGSDVYGTFNPDSNITRAEVAAIVSRIVDPSQRKQFVLQEKPTNSLDNYLGDWSFANFPDSGLTIEKIENDYYLSLTMVQGMGFRVNGTMEPVKLIYNSGKYKSVPFDTMHVTTATVEIKLDGEQLIVSCEDIGDSSFSIDFSNEYCIRD